jgi:uncharacterized protein
MPDYRAPGVYVEEVPSAIKPIAGVSTSTAGFIGVFEDAKIVVPGDRIATEAVGTGDGKKTEFDLKNYPVVTEAGSFAVTVAGRPVPGASLSNDDPNKKAKVTLHDSPADKVPVVVNYVPAKPVILGEKVTGESVGNGDDKTKEFDLRNYPVVTDNGTYTIRVAGVSVAGSLKNDHVNKVAKVELTAEPAANDPVAVDYVPLKPLAPAGEVRLCTNFTEFTKSFGGFSAAVGQRRLAHAVYGFFNNGGTRCYVVREAGTETIGSALAKLGAVDEIAIVAAPGITDGGVCSQIVEHCQIATGDRFAILDGVEAATGEGDLTAQNLGKPANSTYAAFYFPWLQVFDPVTKAIHPSDDGRIYVPPSGHIAGIYARVDAERGVHKAPANEVVMGALGLRYTVSKPQQDGLNPAGINCIRSLNGNIQVWGARTIGGDANADLKFINVRRTLLFLRKSIEQGTQWVVFEPNSPALWQRITRNVTAFLTTVWRSGALFGTTVAEAFYVKCDAETNPPELRDLGQVVTEIGVAIVRPAEFVIFRISQFSGAGA